jgi:hypothetical protein
MTELFIRRPTMVPPPYEGGGLGEVGTIRRTPNPLFHLPLHKGEKSLHFESGTGSHYD